MKISNEYIAGFLDGEASIGISVSKSSAGYPVPNLRVAFSNMHEGVLLAVKDICGGSITGPNENGVYAVHINGKDAYRTLKRVVPYLVVKQDLAVIAIQFHETPFVSPDIQPLVYVARLEAALKTMRKTREGYKAKRGTKMMDSLQEAIHHVKKRIAANPSLLEPEKGFLFDHKKGGGHGVG